MRTPLIAVAVTTMLVTDAGATPDPGGLSVKRSPLALERYGRGLRPVYPRRP